MSAQFQSRVTGGRWPDSLVSEGQMKEVCVVTWKLHRGGVGMVRCWCAARGEARAVQHLGLFVLLSWNALDRIHFEYTTALVHGSRGRSLGSKSSIQEARGSRVARKGGKGGIKPFHSKVIDLGGQSSHGFVTFYRPHLS